MKNHHHAEAGVRHRMCLSWMRVILQHASVLVIISKNIIYTFSVIKCILFNLTAREILLFTVDINPRDTN